MAFTDKFDKEDYYLTPEGYIVLQKNIILKRGYCCQSGCRHCPYKVKPDRKKSKIIVLILKLCITSNFEFLHFWLLAAGYWLLAHFFV
ncbi:MAG: hypothetical protein IPP46_11480 [Bacteroidetes bacterium]|nr:hypothetical protein [Bacteroidota bacterium]